MQLGRPAEGKHNREAMEAIFMAGKHDREAMEAIFMAGANLI